MDKRVLGQTRLTPGATFAYARIEPRWQRIAASEYVMRVHHRGGGRCYVRRTCVGIGHAPFRRVTELAVETSVLDTVSFAGRACHPLNR